MSLQLRRICLVGVRGIGKSTLVQRVLPRLANVDHIVGSAVLRELAGPDFARFDHLPPEVKHGYRLSAIDWMEARQASVGRHILCDGHTSLLDESTGQVGPVFTERDCTFFRELVYLEAPLEVVLARRRADTRKRRSLDPRVVAAEIEGERTTSAQVAQDWGMTLHRLPWGDDDALASDFEEVLRG